MDIKLFDTQLGDYCAEQHFMGAVRVTLKDEIIYERNFGYADIETKQNFDAASMFTYYSVSKPFTAIAFMRLFDRGLIDLEAHPAKYLDEASGFDRGVTLRQILTHTSGLPDFEQDHDFRDNHRPGTPERLREHLKMLSSFPQHFAPGTDTFYANVNFIILALICENLSGKPWADYIRSEVFEPFGMTNAVVDWAGKVINHRVTGYEVENGAPQKRERTTDWVFGAGDIVGTVDDLYRINHAIKNRAVLSKKAWDEVLTPSKINTYGFGCNIEYAGNIKQIVHRGGHVGFRTGHVMMPDDDLDFIMLSNTGTARNARIDMVDMLCKNFYGV